MTVRERHHYYFNKYLLDKKLGPTVLFFGCRHSKYDYLYQEELEEYQQKGVLSDLHVAFSRDQVRSCDCHVTALILA